MKETRYKADPKQPYGLHDCRIDCMEIADGKDCNIRDGYGCQTFIQRK